MTNFKISDRRPATWIPVAVLITFFYGFGSQKALAVDQQAECLAGKAQSCNDVGWQLMKEDKTISARRFFGKGCDLNLAKGCNNMAWILRKQNERREALKYYDRACALNHKTACIQQKVLENRLGIKSQTPKHDSKSSAETEQRVDPKALAKNPSPHAEHCSEDSDNVDCQKLACNNGNSQACMQLGNMASRSGKLNTARSFYQRACGFGASLACVHAKRIPDLPETHSQPDAALLVKNCTNQNASKCISNAENEFAAGNIELALELYEKSCSNQIVYGCVTAARIHFEQGDRVLAKAMVQKLCSFAKEETCEAIRKTACQYDYGWGC